MGLKPMQILELAKGGAPRYNVVCRVKWLANAAEPRTL